MRIKDMATKENDLITEQTFDVKRRFLKNLLSQIVALISKIVVSSIAIVASSVSSETPIQGLQNATTMGTESFISPSHASCILIDELKRKPS